MVFMRYWAAIVSVCLLLCGVCIAPATASEILVGATVSLEGKYQAPSHMIQKAYQLWAKQVNASGGILGRKVRLVLYDDKSRKDLVREYYTKMIRDVRVDLVLAPYGTGLTYEASEVTEAHGFVLMASAASGEMIWNRGYHYVFGVYSIAKRYFIGFLDLVARQGLKTVAIVNDDALFTKDAAIGTRIWAEKLGMQVLSRRTYNNADSEFPEIIKSLETLKPDTVVLCSYPSDGYNFLDHLDRSAYRAKALAMSITPSLPDFASKAGAMAEGVFGPSQWEPDERIPFPGTFQFIEAFQEFAGMNPSYHAGAAFAGCQLLQESVEYVDGIEHAKMRDYISALDTVTVIGRFKVDPQGRQIGHNTLIIQWQKGKKEIVYPSKMRTATPILSR